MADLTRFDFHALRFLKSENVEVMTTEEVGQYLLLMIHAWLGKKDASLPDNPELLSRWAKVKTVSPLVLSMFPVTNTRFGARRQNETLYNEWIAANGRSDIGKKLAEKRWGNAAEDVPALREENTPQCPSQAVPNQTVSVASNGQGDFKTLRLKYRKFFGLTMAGHQKAHEEFAAACAKYGEEKVLAMFEEWAPDNQWIREKRYNYGLKQFYEGLQDQIDSHAEDTPTEFVDLKVVEQIVEAQHAEIQNELAEKQAKESHALENVDQWL